MKKENLLGTWLLVKHGFENPNGEFIPTGENLRGQLMYAPDSSMSVLIVIKPDSPNPKDIIAYSGTFSIAENIVSHHMYVASKGSRFDATEERVAEILADQLILSTAPAAEGRWVITWRRA